MERKDFEVKLRADGFKEIYRWIEPAYGLAVKADRKPFLVVLRIEDFIDLANRAEVRISGRLDALQINESDVLMRQAFDQMDTGE